jgi:hypothetical protein
MTLTRVQCMPRLDPRQVLVVSDQVDPSRSSSVARSCTRHHRLTCTEPISTQYNLSSTMYDPMHIHQKGIYVSRSPVQCYEQAESARRAVRRGTARHAALRYGKVCGNQNQSRYITRTSRSRWVGGVWVYSIRILEERLTRY